MTLSNASPIEFPPHPLARRGVSVTYDAYGHIENVTDATTDAVIPQGPATDGSGTGLDISAIIWLIFSFVVGIPLMLGGVRLWRLTTGLGIGLAATVCRACQRFFSAALSTDYLFVVWASFANSIGPSGISDIAITIISIVAFVLGFLVGLFELGYAVGIATLSLLGGISIGARLVLFRPNLLVPAFFGNWLIITACGLICFMLLLLRQRAAIVSRKTYPRNIG